MVILLWTLAAIGALTIVMTIIVVISAYRDNGNSYQTISPSWGHENALRELDNEVRGRFQTNFRGANLNTPTLNGRVMMIEEYLGIKVDVKEPEPAKLTVKKTRKRKV